MSETKAPEAAVEPAKTADPAAAKAPAPEASKDAAAAPSKEAAAPAAHAPAADAAPKAAWKTKMSSSGGAVFKQVADLGRGLSSPDQPTRRMSLMFFASFIGVCLVMGVTVKRVIHNKQVRSEEDAALKIEQFLHKQEEEARRRFTMMDLGTFTVELKPVPGQRKVPGVVNMGEVTVVVQCDEPNTQVYLEKNLAKVRSQITSVFTALDREDLLTKDGKRKLKKQLMDRINAWLPAGKVVEVFFSSLVVA